MHSLISIQSCTAVQLHTPLSALRASQTQPCHSWKKMKRRRPLSCEDAGDKRRCEVTPTPLPRFGVTPMGDSLTPTWPPPQVLATGGCAKRGSLVGWYESMACPALRDACHILMRVPPREVPCRTPHVESEDSETGSEKRRIRATR